MRYTADFETLASNNEYTYVWAWAVYSIEKDIIDGQGTDIESFFKYTKNKIGDEIYFHNLKFDGRFIIYHLLESGIKHYENKKDVENGSEVFFTSLITADGLYYGIEIVYGFKVKTKKCKNGRVKTERVYNSVKIYDSLKLLNFSVKTIAESFNLEIKKGEIDYKKHREKGYKPTDEEWEYIYNDIKIVGQALKIFFDEGYNKITISSCALSVYQKMMFGNVAKFRQTFPELDYETDAFIRKAYKGGWTYCNPKHQDKIHNVNGLCYDVNSMYPWAMAENPMPYGKPIEFEGEYKEDKMYNLYIQSFVARFKLKEGKFPCIQLKKNSRFADTEYIVDSGDYVELTLTNVDFELFKECYDYDIEYYIGGLKFQSSKTLFNDYINHYMEIKKNEKGAKRSIAKLFLNGLYGKFATSPKRQSNIPYLHDDLLKFKKSEVTIEKTIYTPVAAFATAYARDNIIRTANKCYDRFQYADTDSIHILGDETPPINIHQYNLGAWKLEYKYVKSRHIRAKTYIEELENGELVVRVAGMPDNVKEKLNFDNFERGFTAGGKLQQKNVKGGVVLVDTTFTIK